MGLWMIGMRTLPITQNISVCMGVLGKPVSARRVNAKKIRFRSCSHWKLPRYWLNLLLKGRLTQRYIQKT